MSTVTMLESPKRNGEDFFDNNEESGMLSNGSVDDKYDFSFIEYRVRFKSTREASIASSIINS
jgi:hypothetical protein